MRLRLALAAGLWGLLLAQGAEPAQAHGARLEVVPQAVEITATFDTGEPMADAQVSVYAPDALDAPWQSAQTDSDGRFLFAPRADAPAGVWEVTVRKAGHGKTTTFDLGVVSSNLASSEQSLAQKWLGVVAIVWGCVGTSLYFLRKGDSGRKNLDTRRLPQPPLREAATATFVSDAKASRKESR